MENYDLSANTLLVTVIKSIQQVIRSNLARFPVIHGLKNRYKAYSRRRGVLYLLNYDNHMLDDMGFSRQYLHAISRLPLSIDTDQIRKRLAGERRLPRLIISTSSDKSESSATG